MLYINGVSKKPRYVFSYNLRKHCRICIFGRNITEKVSNQDAIFSTQLMILHYLAKLKTRKLYLFK